MLYVNHLMPMLNLWKYLKTFGFSDVFRGYRNGSGVKRVNPTSVWKKYKNYDPKTLSG